MKDASRSKIGRSVRTLPGPVLCLLLGSTVAFAAEPTWQSIPLNEGNFDVSHAAKASFEKRGGRDALCINGEAFLRDVSLESGSIAVDIANDHHRHFANLIFRAAAHDQYETAYLRMHKSGQFDAVQYTPHLNGETNWQLFGEAQARADFGSEPWITLHVDFAGNRARVWVGPQGDNPALETHLTLPSEAGGIGLRTLFEGCFSNFRYTSELPDFGIASEPGRVSAPDGAIMRWSLSDAFAFEKWEGLRARLPETQSWFTANAEPNGRLLLSRYRRKASSGAFEQNGLDAVYAATAIYSGEPQTAELQIDASDMATVWLNGTALFAFDNSFRAKGPLYRGDFDATKQTISLQLEAGRNELVVLVGERANGWGLAGVLTAKNELTVKPFEFAE